MAAGACAAPDAPTLSTAVDNGAVLSDDGDRAGDVIVVLPPADRLAPSERVRVRMLVERAIEEVFVSGPTPALLEPATSDALHDAVETAVRRADTVCVMGRDAQAALLAALALYPSRTGCLLPFPGPDPAGALAVDVDLGAVGRELGVTARTVAEDGTVVVVDGGDGMLDLRWSTGVLSGASAGGTVLAQHRVTTASELLELLDDQAARGPLGGSLDGPGRDDLPLALTLPPVRVVVLDASGEAAGLVEELLSRGLRVLVPRSLVADRPEHPGVVLRWRVRWDVAMTVLLRRVLEGETAEALVSVALEDVLVLDAGPAAPRT